ncbi:unnamed protein product [Dicrocoelium dendriticum]|nr:unnamed protein product [Dicrocoelium dendriticum]
MHDLKGHIENFRRQLRALRFRHDVDYYGLSKGNPGAFLEFYRHLLCDHSTELTKLLVGKGFAILGTSDYRFMETVYRMLRDLLRLHPPITLTQFYTNGFAEKKLEMACQITAQCGSLIARSSANTRLTKQGNLRRGRGSCQTSGITYSIPFVLPEVSCIPVEADNHQPVNE